MSSKTPVKMWRWGFPIAFLLILVMGFPVLGKSTRKPRQPAKVPNPAEASPTSNVVASPVVTLYSEGEGNAREGASGTTPLRRARDLLVSGQEPAAVEFLRQVIASATETDLPAPSIGKQEPEIRRLLADLLTARATKLRGTAALDSLSPESAEELQGLLREARDIEPYALERWRVYLETLGGNAEHQAVLAAEGQALFTKFGQGLASASLSPWRPTLEKQETIFVRLNLPLERLACLELLARIPGIPESTGSLARTLREELLKRRREFLERLDWLIVRGEAWEAEILLAHLRRLDGENQMLGRLDQRLQVVKRCQELLLQVSMAVRDGDLPKATLLAKQVLDIDSHNPHAIEYLKKIEEIQRGPQVPGKSGKDRIGLLRKELQARLKEAEQREDLLAIRKVLKEFIFWAIAEPAHRERLRTVEAELMDARFHLEDRWNEAQELFRKESWTPLRRLLNRNPALGEDPNRVLGFWEMNLVCDYVQERIDSNDLEAQLSGLEKKHPKSFWALWLRMRLAMDRRDYPKADEAYFKAVELQPDHPALKGPGRVLWAQRHGWKIIPFILLFLFYLMGRSLSTIMGWLEEVSWRMNARMIRLMPGLALRWLESRFGGVRDGEPRLRLFRLLTRAAFAAGQSPKGERYAELLLEMSPRDALAIEELGRYLLSQPVLDLKRLEVITAFAMVHADDRTILEKAGKAVMAARAIGSDVVPLLKRYLSAFPEDQDMTGHLAGLYQTLRPSEVGRDGLELMERAWRVSGDQNLWIGIWRVQVACGVFDRARDFLIEAVPNNNAPPPLPMLESYEAELVPEITAMQRVLSGGDRLALAGVLKRIPELKYLTDRLAAMILEPLESLSLDEDTGTRYQAQKARDHLREVVRQSGHFRKSIADVQASAGKVAAVAMEPAGEAAPSDDTTGAEGIGTSGPAEQEVLVADEGVQDQPMANAEPQGPVEAPSESLGIAQGVFSDLDAVAPAPMSPDGSFFSGPYEVDLFADLDPPSASLEEPSSRSQGEEDAGLGDPVSYEEPVVAAEVSSEPVECARVETVKTSLEQALQQLSRETIETGGEVGNAEMVRLQELITASGPDDLLVWEAWLNGAASLGLLQATVRLLGTLRTPLLTPILLRFAEHADARVRANVIEGLEANGDPAAIPALSGFLRDQDNRIRGNAMKALQSFGLQSIVDELRKMVADSRVNMRDSAIYVLRGLKNAEGMKMLVTLLSDQEPTIRRNAIRALAQQGRKENLEPLQMHLQRVTDKDERELAEKAIKALMELGKR